MSLRRDRCRGTTLVELLIALAMSAMVVGLVFSLWQLVNRQIASGQHSAQLNADATRAGELVCGVLRKAQGVLHVTESELAVVIAPSLDTVVVSVQGSVLLVNDTPFVFLDKQTSLQSCVFSAEHISGPDNAGPRMITVHLVFGNGELTREYRCTVAASPLVSSQAVDQFNW